MLLIFMIQIALFSLLTAQNVSTVDTIPGWWLRVTPERSPPQSAQIPCPVPGQSVAKRDDYTYTPGIGGHKVHTHAVTWPEARRTCEQEGGHLAIINSIAEANVVASLWENAESVFGGTGNVGYAAIGFHDLFQEGEYINIHDQTLAKAGYTRWAAGQPDNANGVENCGSVYKDGGLNDIPCTKTYAYICELPDA